MYALKKFFFHSPGHYIAAVILAIGMGVFRFVTLPAGISAQFVWYEVLTVSGYVTFLIGALLTVAYFGAFDIFGYAFSSWRSSGLRKYKNYTEYSYQKNEKRARGKCYFVPYYVVGIALVLISNLFM